MAKRIKPRIRVERMRDGRVGTAYALEKVLDTQFWRVLWDGRRSFALSSNRELRIVAEWDDEADVWVATSEDVPGLVTEAASREVLVARLRSMVPELLELNRHLLADRICPKCGSQNERP